MSGPYQGSGAVPAGGPAERLPSIAELFDLRGKVALVTGGAMGIGEATALRLASAGARVMIADVDLESARRVVRRIKELGFDADEMKVDAGSRTDPGRAIDETVRRLGDLHIVVNNAGIFPFSRAVETTVELWDRVFDVNLRGAFLFSQAAARVLMARGHEGSIVNIASIDAFRPTGNLSHYDASKAGLVMLTRSLAFEFGRQGIRVNAIAPGGINTPGVQTQSAAILKATGAPISTLLGEFLRHIPLGRMGDPDDIARAVLFFASRASEYVTGSVLVVDGGYLVA